MVLLDDSKDRIYLAQTGVIGAGANRGSRRTKTIMSVSGARSLKDGEDQLVLTFTSPEVGGIKLVKTYTLRRGAYDIAVKHELTNTSGAPLTPSSTCNWCATVTSPKARSSFYSTFTGPAVYTAAKKYQKVEFRTSSPRKPTTSTRPTKATLPWCSTTL